MFASRRIFRKDREKQRLRFQIKSKNFEMKPLVEKHFSVEENNFQTEQTIDKKDTTKDVH